jgi:hypothetical protein
VPVVRAQPQFRGATVPRQPGAGHHPVLTVAQEKGGHCDLFGSKASRGDVRELVVDRIRRTRRRRIAAEKMFTYAIDGKA